MLLNLLRSLRLSGLVLLMALTQPVRASHLLGGEMTYRYLDNNGPASAPARYEITVAVYNNCGTSTVLRSAAVVGIYDQTTGNQVVLTAANYFSTISIAGQPGFLNVTSPTSTGCISPAIPPGCNISGASQPYNLQKFVAVVNLPNSTAGYYALFTDGTRNADVSNLDSPSSYTLMLYVALSPPSVPNRSPVFSDEAVAIICTNDTTTLLNNAVDADGDRLVYTFGQPYGEVNTIGLLPSAFLPPPPLVPYVVGPGYAPITPFGTAPGNFALLNANTGIAKYGATVAGQKYVVAIDIKEYRVINGQERLIGTTRRDLQLVIASCPPTTAPVVPPPTVIPRNYTIEAGATLSIPLTAVQTDGHPLTLTANSQLLDGNGPYNATFGGSQGTVAPGSLTGTASTTGTGTVTGTFVYKAGCNEARATPYDVAFSVKDNGCAGKTVADVLHITVIKPTGPTAISGPTLVCDPAQVVSYQASGGTAPGVSWRLSGGGTFVGPRTANPVQVQWATAGTYTITARGLTQYGCLTDSVTKTVTVAPPLTVSGLQLICQGASTTLTAAGGTTYTVTGGPTTLTGAGPFTVTPSQTTTYTVSTATTNGCTPSRQVTVTVLPQPLADVGPPAFTICSGVPFTLGATPVAGNTYSWISGGLVVATTANPTFTISNTSGVPIIQTYTLTETNAANCKATNTVTVTVNPAPVVTPGANLMFCSGNTGQLGAPAVAGITYSWSPATGLSSTTVANPTVTLTNTTGAPISQTYTLTVVSATLPCPNMGTVTVTVNSVLLPGSIGADQTVCPVLPAAPLTQLTAASGGTGTYTYQWEASPDNLTWTAIAGATGATYAPGVVSAATYYRRRVQSADCAAAVSNVVQFTLLPVLTSGVQLPAVPAQCAGTPMTFTALPTNAGPAPTYRWFVNGTLAATTTVPTFTSSTLADGDQVSVEQTVTAGFCATGPATDATIAHLIPVPPPGVTMSGKTPMPVCEGTPLTFSLDQATNPSATPKYQWLVDGQPVAGATNTTFVTTTLHEGQVVVLQLTAATVCGPRTVVSAGVVAHVDPAVDVDAGTDDDIMLGDELVLQGTANGSYLVLWSPALGLSSATVLRPVATPQVTTTYTLSATRGQCSDESSVTIVVHPRLRIPSAFSPNGDGTDDNWQIENLGEYANNHVLIFNRWGSKLFETRNYGPGNEWSGTINGQPAPVGTYYYIITVKNHSYTGPITIVY